MAIPTPTIYIKQGATFSQAGYATLPDGDWIATSEIRDNAGTLVTELDVTLQPPVAPNTKWPLLLFKSAEETELWPIGTLYCDIRFDYSGNILYIPTFIVQVVKHITGPQPTLVLGGG